MVIPGGGSGGGWEAEIKTGVGLATVSNRVAVFRDELFIQLDLYRAPSSSRVQTVDFVIFDNDTGETVHVQSEESAGYCSFGGGDPCNALRLDHSARWPSTGLPVRNHNYTVEITALLADGNANTWSAQFGIASPALADATIRQALVASITETGPGNNLSLIHI